MSEDIKILTGHHEDAKLVIMELRVATVDNNGEFKNVDINIWVSEKDAKIISTILKLKRSEQRFDCEVKRRCCE